MLTYEGEVNTLEGYLAALATACDQFPSYRNQNKINSKKTKNCNKTT